MWYEILVENEVAEYFMRSEGVGILQHDEKTAAQMLEQYANIVYGVTMAWSFAEIKDFERLKNMSKGMDPYSRSAFEFCHSQLHLTQTKTLGEVWNSILPQVGESRYDVDVKLLNAEQCAVLLMYPFWSRMGGSLEESFQKNGDLKKYLYALKEKCMKKQEGSMLG